MVVPHILTTTTEPQLSTKFTNADTYAAQITVVGTRTCCLRWGVAAGAVPATKFVIWCMPRHKRELSPAGEGEGVCVGGKKAPKPEMSVMQHLVSILTIECEQKGDLSSSLVFEVASCHSICRVFGHSIAV